MRFFTIFSCLVLLAACQNNVSNSSDQVMNPETTVRQWQACMDKNDFKNAQKLSSEETKKWLEGIAAAFSGDTIQIQTEFEEIKCEEKDEKAMCVCKVKQNIADESYEDVFLLIKENGRWVVDLDNIEELNNGFLEVVPQDSAKNMMKK